MLPIVSLFAGIGGLELGLERAGFGPVVAQVETDQFCRSVLAHHWPEADRSVRNVQQFKGSKLVGSQHLLCGGFPCQDVSSAGKRRGLAGKRSGLWYEFRRIIAETRPQAIVVENVRSGARAWLPFVCGDLVDLGYRVRALGIGARDVGAPHRRDRVFVLGLGDADSSKRYGRRESDAAARSPTRGPRDPTAVGLADRDGGRLGEEREPVQGRGDDGAPGNDAHGRDRQALPDSDGERLREQRQLLPGGRPGDLRARGDAVPCGSRREGPAPPESGLGVCPDGLPAGVATCPAGGPADAFLGWPAGRGAEPFGWEPPRAIDEKLPGAADMLHALGNAVVPQCAHVAGLVLRQWMEIQR